MTLAWLAGRAGRPVRLWSRDPHAAERLPRQQIGGGGAEARIEVTQDIGHALEAGAVVLAIQPDHLRSLLRGAARHFRPEQRVVHAVGGFERGGTPVSQVVQQETCAVQVGAVAGPVVPFELARGQECVAVIGSRFQAVIDEARELLAGPQVRVYGSRDLVGVEVGGAMRPPLAIGAGLLQGSGMGRALHAVLLTRGIAEAGRLAAAMGGDARTLSGLSGIGDWMLTTTDPEDPLVRAGVEMARGRPWEHAEGASRVRTLLGLARDRGVDMPICAAVGAVLDGSAPGEALRGLMAREAGTEFE